MLDSFANAVHFNVRNDASLATYVSKDEQMIITGGVIHQLELGQIVVRSYNTAVLK